MRFRKWHLQNKNMVPYHIAFNIYGGYYTKCGLNGNKALIAPNPFPGGNFCKKCTRLK